MPIQKIELIRLISEYFYFDLSNSIYSLLDVNTDSTIYNTFSFFCILMLAFAIHFLVAWVYRCLSKRQDEEKCSCFCAFCRWTANKAYRILTFGLYIRMFLGMNQYLLICSVYEINNFNVSKTQRIISLLFAFLVLFQCLVLILTTFCLLISSYQITENGHNKIGEFYSGIKIQKKFKIYTFMLLLRRALFVVLLVTLVSTPSWLLIVILSIFQFIYLIFIIALRPFKLIKGNIIEIINELYFLLLLSILIFLNEKEDWNESNISVYMWTLISNSICSFIIVFIGFLYQVVIKCIKFLSNPNQTQVTPIIATPQPSSIQTNKVSHMHEFKVKSKRNPTQVELDLKFEQDRCPNNKYLIEENKIELEEDSSHFAFEHRLANDNNLA